VPEKKQSGKAAASTPVVMVPVTAEDVRRQKIRTALKILGAVALAALVLGWIYKRATDPINARASYDAGTMLLQAARYEEAILALTQAIEMKPDFAEAYRMRGRVYFEETELERSVSDYTAAVKLRPSDPLTLLDRAAAYLAQKDYAAAMADCDRAIALDSMLAAAFNLRGSTRRAQGDARAALADFDRAVALAPNLDNYYQRGATYQILGEYRKAIADFTEVIGIRPDNAPPYFARADALRAAGELERAREDLKQGRILDGR
jgi:tetratricopeptide (TPR) repeat protein